MLARSWLELGAEPASEPNAEDDADADADAGGRVRESNSRAGLGTGVGPGRGGARGTEARGAQINGHGGAASGSERHAPSSPMPSLIGSAAASPAGALLPSSLPSLLDEPFEMAAGDAADAPAMRFSTPERRGGAEREPSGGAGGLSGLPTPVPVQGLPHEEDAFPELAGGS